MMNLIGVMTAAYFLTGLLLYARSLVKVVKQMMTMAMSGYYDERMLYAKIDEAMNEIKAKLDPQGASSTSPGAILGCLVSLVLWPAQLKNFEELTLEFVRILRE